MHLNFRLPEVAFVLLLAAAAAATAQTPLPDPVAPAVVGRPLEQIRPVAPSRHRAAVAKVDRPKQLVTSEVAAAPASPPATATVAVAPAAAALTPTMQHAPKQALDDRFDPHAQPAPAVGSGTHLGRKPLGSGAYLNARAQALIQDYYATHPASGKRSNWSIGETVPPRAAMTGVPDEVRAALPRVPPGHQYVELDGDVVLVAVQSRMVVDGVSRQR
jgi:Ni/Co efflux regulator RcnB